MRHILKHSGRYVYRHEDLIAIAGECGGQILSLFEFWTSCRMAEQDRVRSLNRQLRMQNKSTVKEPDNWLLETIEDIRAGLLDGWGISSIKRAIKELVAANYLLEGKAKNPWLRTKTYQLNIPEVQKALDAWQSGQYSDLGEAQNLDSSDELNSTHRGVENNPSSGLNERQTIYINNPSKHSQSEPSLVCVDEEREELRSKEESSPINSSFVPQIRNPESSTLQPGAGAAGVPSAKWSSVEALIESILVDPYLEATDPIPPVIKSEMKSRGWLLPWRNLEWNATYNTLNPKFVDSIAKKRVNWNNSNGDHWRTKIPDIVSWIVNNESSRGGWEKIMSEWAAFNKSNGQPLQSNPVPAIAPEPEAKPENQPTQAAIDPDRDPDILLESEWRDPLTNRRMRFIAPIGRIHMLMPVGNNHQWVIDKKIKFANILQDSPGRAAFIAKRLQMQEAQAQKNK